MNMELNVVTITAYIVATGQKRGRVCLTGCYIVDAGDFSPWNQQLHVIGWQAYLLLTFKMPYVE